MAQKKHVKPEQVTMVHRTKGTRVTVAASMATKMLGYVPADRVDEVGLPEGDPTGYWTVAQLRTFAASSDVDLTGASNKAEILERLAAADDEDPDEGEE